jgi:type IV pilus assembly protein PilY1
MRNAVHSFLRASLKLLLGCVLTLYVAAPTYAFTPAQFPLLSASAVAPNLMLLVDNSGSMNHVLRDAAYNNANNYGNVYNVDYRCGLFSCTYFQSDQIVGENVYVSSFSRGSCNNGYYMFYTNSSTSYCLKLPTPSGTSTLYSSNYLAYLISITGALRVKDFTTSSIPQQSRISAAIDVATDLITNNRAIRTGLAVLNPTSGSVISYPVSDISTTDTTGNFNKLKTAISGLTANGGTPLAETYYDITRYFRGMTSFYTRNTQYTSPIQYRCQKNYGVVITDGLPSTDSTFPTAGQDPADPTGRLPNWDGNLANDGPRTGSNADGDTLYLDDLALFAYDIDMRTNTSTPALDNAGKSWDNAGFLKQNMVTYTVGYTVSNQMLIDAAAYGHGAYYQANGSDALSDALNAALNDINSKAGSGGGGAASSTTLQAGTRFYQTLYDPTDWHGTIRAYSLDATTGALGTQLLWNTDTTITTSATAPVYESYNTNGNGSVIPLSFTNFSAAQQLVLTNSVPTTPAGITGADLVQWTKGINKTGLRTRTLILGDIINSPLATAFPGAQTATDLQGDSSYTGYLAFKAANMNSSLLANGNDGFVHVVNADNGTQRYAYMPSLVLPSISTIAATDYGVSKHKFTVDGQISVFDTQKSAGGAWQTMAIGGLGAGGKSFYALQLFDDSGSNTIKALWEIRAPDTNTPANDFNDLGFAYSKPEVARMAGGAGIVVVGNGYGSFNGTAALFVLNAQTGALIKKITVPVASGETDNGLSSVKLLVNSQNIVQAAYAGDLKGHLWKFDLSAASPTAWGVAFGGKPLFTAPRGAVTTTVNGVTTTSNQQPITVQPLLLDHPLNGKLVYFGTGKFNETADKTTTAQQDFYAVWDGNAGTGGIVEADLQQQLIGGAVISGGSTYYTSSNNDVDWATKKGWYLPLATAAPYLGERIIYPAQTSRGRIIFTTAAVNSSDPCESTGTGRLFELDAATGSILSYPALDTNADGDITSSDMKVSGIAIGTGIPTLASVVNGTNGANDNKYVLDSSGGTPTKLLEKGGSVSGYQRIMWRQIQ